MASPYIAIANGTSFVVPSLDMITFFLFTKSLDGLEFEFCIEGSMEGSIYLQCFLKLGSGLGS